MSKRRIALLVVSIVLWLLIDVAMVFVIPVFAAMFADFGAKLPSLTQTFIDLSNASKASWFIYRPVFTGGLTLASVAVARAKKRGPVVLFFLSGALAVMFLIAALFLPIFQLGAVAGGLQ